MEKKEYIEICRLVGLAMKGDHGAFSRICELRARNVLYSCTKIMGNLHDGEDAAQEVFLRMQKKIHTLREPAAFFAWSQKLISSVCFNMRQKNMNVKDDVSLDDFSDLFSETDGAVIPEEYLTDQEKHKELMAIIDGLPVRTKACVLMYYFDELSTPEVAEAMEITEGAVRSHLFLGREKIRKTLETKDAAAYTGKRKMVSMHALGGLFLLDMQQLITPQMVSRCVSGATVPGFSLLRWMKKPAVRNTLLTSAAAAATVALFVSLSQFASPPSSTPVPNVSENPQISIMAPGRGDEDMPASNGDGRQADAPSDSSPSGSDGGKPGQNPLETRTPPPAAAVPDVPATQAPTSAPGGGTTGQPSAKRTPVFGRVAIGRLSSQQAAAQDVFAGQYYVKLEKDGKQLGLSAVDASGGFAFEELQLQESGSYTISVVCVHNYGLGTTPASQIELVAGQAFTLAEPLTIVDNDDPILSLQPYSAADENTAVNPDRIEIYAFDATKLSLQWEILPADGGKAAAAGSDELIKSDVLSTLAKGKYEIVVTATDAVGNTSYASQVFHITKYKNNKGE